MKFCILIIGFSLILSGCSLHQYALVCKNGLIINNIKSKEDCENINKVLKLNGICVFN